MSGKQDAAQQATSKKTIALLDAKNGRIGHKPKGSPYAHFCNREAIRDFARKPGIIGVDLDTQPNKEGTPFVHHQAHPTKNDAWFDPQHKINDSHHCRTLDDAQMHRLRVRYQGKDRPILTAHQAAGFCLTVRGGPLVPCFEAKGQDRRYLDPDWWFEKFVRGWDAKLQPVIMTLPGTGGGSVGLNKLEAAHEVGLPTMWLWRGKTAVTESQAFRDAVDLVKSRPGRGIYRV
jgi:hypothetical protein